MSAQEQHKIPNTIPTPHTVDHIFGLRRSGHHAVINWLAGCYEAAGERPTHDNSVFNAHLLPFESHWPDPSPATVWERNLGHDVLLVSYEDVDLDERNDSPNYHELRPPKFGNATKDIIVVRDWFNFVASRLKYQADQAETQRHYSLIFALDWSEVQARWLQYAGLALRGDQDSPGLVTVNYNQWFANPEYREGVAEKLGLPDSENGLDHVPDFGSGSSFDQRSMDGNGRQMNVLRRWEGLDPALLQRYKRLIYNPVMGEINQRLFGIDQAEVLASVGYKAQG